jgi:predicted transcriptional regulator
MLEPIPFLGWIALDPQQQEKKMGALSTVRKIFIDSEKPLTLSEIAAKTNLKAPEISMALCHLRQHRYVSREQVANDSGKGRKQVWSYEYHADRSGA